MAKNIIFILTEGEHDAAFIYRILKANGMQTKHSIAIKDYPLPLNELIKNELQSAKIDELKMQEARSKFLPSYVMKKDDNFISIYRVGGDSRNDIRIDFIRKINDFNTFDSDAIQVLKDTEISVLFFFDADNIGVHKRIEQIKKELAQSFSETETENINRIENKKIAIIKNINIGSFIFTEAESDNGLLEDILIPLMKQGNDDIFEKAEEFLGIHKNTNLFKDVIKDEIGKNKKVNEKKYIHKKSLIGTVGQLQMSGKSNTVCISDSDYLSKEKITTNSTCVEIYNFIKKILK